MKKKKQANPIGAKLIRLAKGLAIPIYFEPILKACKYKYISYTKKAIETGNLLKISYMPGHIELTATQQELEEAIQKAKNINLKIYHGKKHVTITDGIYKIKILKTNAQNRKENQ
ncbi:MAG: hypothetical protein ACXQTI_09620 [Candidatus Nezhaarchaeales archaeon]